MSAPRVVKRRPDDRPRWKERLSLARWGEILGFVPMAGHYAIGIRPELADLHGLTKFTDAEARRVAAALRRMRAP